MRRWLLRSALVLLAGVTLSSCTEQSLNPVNEKSPIQASLMAGPTTVRISQIYGGGGSTSTNPVPAFKNDYVELFNYGSQDVDVSGWRLQYSAAGATSNFNSSATSTQNTQFPAGTIIPAGKYFLVRLAAATGATGADITAFDASGNTSMAAASGKLLLSTGATWFATSCPDDATIVDRVGYGAYGCAAPVPAIWNSTTPTLSTTTAAFRAQNGCSASTAFASGVPSPRSLATARQTCVSVSVSPAAQSVVAGASTNPLDAKETDAGGNVVSTTFTWTSSDNNVATVVDGVVTGVTLGTATITATATDGTKGTATVTVIAGPVVRATIDPTSATVVRGGTQQFLAKGYDAHDQQNTAAVFTWDTDNHSLATVDATGKVTTLNVGTVTVTATTNGVPVSATLEIIAPAIASVAVDPQAATTNPNATAQFTAMARDADGHDIPGVTFTWASSNANVATVDATGKATGKSLGTVNITATSPNGKVGTAQLEVLPPPVLHITEIHYDNNGTDAGEAIEIEGPAGLNLAAYSIVLYSGSTGSATAGQLYNTRILSGVITNQCSGRGTISFTYPSNGIQNGDKDGMALVGPAGVVEFLSYEGSFAAVNGPAAGMQSTDIGVSEGGSGPTTESLQRDNATGRWFGPETSNFGSCNPPTPPPHLSIVGRLPSDPPLPVGFEDQIFANEIDAFGDTLDTNFTWESLTPAIATIDQRGVIHGVADGLATFRATASDGIARNWSLPVATATAGNGVYRNNVEFGTPTDADPSNDIMITRPQYTISYSPTRNTPNWASYEINSTTVGAGEDRCDCFTFDPSLPSTLARYNTGDYTGAGAAAGFSIARGHLVRSFDRTNGSLDNAVTYYFSNIVPQAGNMNSGPWGALETALGDMARTGGKEVYIMTGVIGSRGTVKNEGVITIPASMWKVAVIVPAGTGLAGIDSFDDLEVIAVNMPNDPNVNSDWKTYKTTVDQIEALSGYDLLSLLPDRVEAEVEANSHFPTAAVNGPFAANVGVEINMSAAGTTNTDAGETVTYAWTFGDNSTGSGVSVAHTYAHNGTFNVCVTATDNKGLADEKCTTATITDPTAAVITPTVTGTKGLNDWYIDDIGISWSVVDNESGVASKTGCDAITVSANIPNTTYTCTAVNGQGTSSNESVTVKRDASAPTVVYTGNAVTYSVSDQVNITCTATDVGPSGLASNDCADISGAAYTFVGLANSYSATAKDNAGNVGNGSTSFTVVVTTSGLQQLVTRWSKNAGMATSLNAKLNNGQVNAFIYEVEAQRGKAFTNAQADELIRLAKAL